MINDHVQNVGRALHDVGLAAWMGGQVFGKFALDPAVKELSDPRERGRVASSAWMGFNQIGTTGLGAAAVVRVVARLTEMRGSAALTPTERSLNRLQDGLMLAAIGLTAATGAQGKQLSEAGGGAPPIGSGDQPSGVTPQPIAEQQRTVGTLGTLTLVLGTSLVALNGVVSRLNFSRPPLRRAFRRRSA
jgi:hypothetical protein